MAAPCAGAAKLDDTPTRPRPKLTNAATKIARILILLASSREALTQRLPCSGVWRAYAALREWLAPRIHPSIGLRPNRPVPQRQTPLAENLRSAIRTARGWRIHRLFMARCGINSCPWAHN